LADQHDNSTADEEHRLRAAIMAAPHDAGLHTRLGQILFERGDFAGAAR